MLRIDNASCGYGGADIVRGISLEVSAGDRLAVIGPNGCGKTTLLRTMSGLLPYKGSVTIDGRELSSLKRREISSKIALMTQQNEIYFDYTVYDTVALGRYLKSKKSPFSKNEREEKETVLKFLKELDLLSIKDKNIRELSGGQLQRVYLARTIAQEPDIILLDEPTNFLDIRYQLELTEYLKEWSKSGSRAIVGVFHDLNLAMGFSSEALLMNEGEKILFGRTSEVLKSDRLKEAYGFDIKAYMNKSLEYWK